MGFFFFYLVISIEYLILPQGVSKYLLLTPVWRWDPAGPTEIGVIRRLNFKPRGAVLGTACALVVKYGE